MNKFFLMIICSLFFISCKEEQPQAVSLQKTKTTKKIAASNNPIETDDFSDLKKEDDEACDTEEELLEKQIEKAKKQKDQPMKLQGGDEGCEVN